MTLEQLRDSLPEYAKDMKLNLSNVLQPAELTKQQTWGTALACTIAARNQTLLAAIAAEARTHLSEQAFAAAEAAATVMGMNNIYYRFLHLVKNEKYRTIPARLRMNVIRTHGVEPADFELWCLAVSAINNCEACIGSHEAVVKEKGLSEEAIVAAVRIAAVIHSVATVLEAEAAIPKAAAAV
jgi:alkyl hydroperoxide reductase subunit D